MLSKARVLATMAVVPFIAVACDDRKAETLKGPVAVVEGPVPTHGVLGVSFAGGADGSLDVTDVVPGSPAAAAGVAAGDRVTSVDGADVDRFAELQAKLKQTKPGQVVRLGVRRGEEAKVVDVALLRFEDALVLRERAKGGASKP